ncbi:MAG: TRAP transporter small permease [Sedimentibacter sp.]|uniref:TRAP transporter small permease n=1 Tax=Sedimentibacter sp. TaxID=1960295 RepID=UPI003158BC45
MNNKNKWYNEIESTICVIIMIFMLVTLFFQVIVRYLFGYSYAWIDELSRYSLIWFAYLAAVYAIIHNAHIKIDLFLNVWPKKVRNFIQLLSNVIFFIYCIAVTYFSTHWLIGLNKAGTVSMGTGVSMALFSSIIPLSHFLMAIRLIQLEVKLIRNPELLVLVDEADAAIQEAKTGGVNKK